MRTTLTPAARNRALAPLALAACLGLALVVVWRATVGGEVLSSVGSFVRSGGFDPELKERVELGPRGLGDPHRQFEAWTIFQARHLERDGALPLWKDTTLCGAPLLGNGQSAMLAPLNLAAVALGDPPWAKGVIALLKLGLGAFLAYLLGRHLGLGPPAALVTGISFGFFGFQVAFLLFPHVMVSMLLPALVLAADRAALRPTAGRVVVLALVCALQHVGGHPETVFHSQAVAAVLVVVRVVASWRAGGCPRPVRTVAVVASGFVLGAMLAAPHVLPLVEYILQSEMLRERAGHDGPRLWVRAPLATAGYLAGLAAAAAGAVRLRRQSGRVWVSALLLLVGTLAALRGAIAAGASDHFVALLSADWLGDLRRPRTGGSTYVGDSIFYFGPALALASLGYLAGRSRVLVRVVTVVLVVCLLVAFRGPLFEDLIGLVPPFSVAANTRLTLVAQLCSAVLAGIGLEALLAAGREPGLRRRWLALTLAPIAGLILASTWASFDGHVGPRLRFPRVPLDQGELVDVRVDSVTPQGSRPGGRRSTRLSGTLTVAAGVEPRELLLDTGDRRQLPVSLGESERGPSPSPAEANTRSFAVNVPPWTFASDRQRIRFVLITAAGRSASELVRVPGTPPRLASIPLLPAEGRAPQQLALLAAVVAGVYVVLRWPRTAGAGRAALVLFCAGSVLCFARGYNPSVPRECFFPLNPDIERLQQLGPDERVLVMDAPRYPAETLTAYDVTQVGGYDALVPFRSARLHRAALDRPGGNSRISELPQVRNPELPLLGMMAVSHVFHPRTSKLEPNPHFLPRARLVREALVEPDDERALERLGDPDFPHADTILLAEGPGRTSSATDLGTVSFERDEPDHLVLRVRAEVPCTLLLADTYFPGWEATVDGRPRAIQRADLAFRALSIEPGDERVEFRYRPGSLRLGLALALLALATCGLILWRSSRSARE